MLILCINAEDRTPIHSRTSCADTHTHTHLQLGAGGRKTENPEKAHMQIKRTCETLHRSWICQAAAQLSTKIVLVLLLFFAFFT